MFDGHQLSTFTVYIRPGFGYLFAEPVKRQQQQRKQIDRKSFTITMDICL